MYLLRSIFQVYVPNLTTLNSFFLKASKLFVYRLCFCLARCNLPEFHFLACLVFSLCKVFLFFVFFCIRNNLRGYFPSIKQRLQRNKNPYLSKSDFSFYKMLKNIGRICIYSFLFSTQ